MLEVDLDRAHTTTDAQGQRAAIAEATRGIPLPAGVTIPVLEDLDGAPGILLSNAQAVLIEDGRIAVPEEPAAQSWPEMTLWGWKTALKVSPDRHGQQMPPNY